MTSSDTPGWTARGVHVALVDLVATAEAMAEVLASGRCSDTPDEPVWLKARDDMPGRWEIADGHHRVAAAIRAGATTVLADLDPVPDDELYEPPFHDFTTRP